MEQSGTFANFNLRKNEGFKKAALQTLEAAYNGAVNFANNPSGWIAFTGKPGSGMTHLAAAIANECSEKFLSPLFTTVPDLLDHLRDTFNPRSTITFDKQFLEIKNAPILILDDLDTHSATPWANEKLYQLFNFRYLGNRPTVITISDLDNLHSSSPRLFNKIANPNLCKVYDMGVPAYFSFPKKTQQTLQKKEDKAKGY